MIIGITGGTGFIGEALALRHLEHGDVVRLLLRKSKKDLTLIKGIDYFFSDITGSIEELKKFANGLEVLYHCAGEIHKIDEMQHVNVFGTENLSIAANRRIGHFVHLSSVGVYGPHNDGVITEDTSLNPINEYEKSKSLADQIVIEFAGKGAFTYSILRPSNVFGPSMTNQSIYKMIDMINKGFFFFIGKPGASANYIHVENVVNSLMLCAKKDDAKNQIYNISDYCTIEEFVSIISKALNKSIPKLRLPEFPVRLASKIFEKLPHFPLTESRVNALVNRSIYKCDKIRNELDYKHVISMENGLKEVVSHLNHGNA